MGTRDMKDRRKMVADVVHAAVIDMYGKDRVTRDDDRYLRVKFPGEHSGPTYIRIDLKMEP